MTIQTQYIPDHYVGDGSTADLPFTWRILAKTDIRVYAVDEDDVLTTMDLDSEYTIADSSVNNPNGGTVTLVDPTLWDGQDIFIVRDTARTQLVHLEEGRPFPAATIEKVFDRITMMVQELKYLYRQTLHFPPYSASVDIIVPEPESGMFLGWQDGELVNFNIGDMGDEETVSAGAENFQVTFDTPLDNADYMVISTGTSWNSTAFPSAKTTTGFLVTFGTAAPSGGGTLTWRIVTG